MLILENWLIYINSLKINSCFRVMLQILRLSWKLFSLEYRCILRHLEVYSCVQYVAGAIDIRIQAHNEILGYQNRNIAIPLSVYI